MGIQITEEVKTVTVKTRIYVCDECFKTVSDKRLWPCVVCGKLICFDCYIPDERDPGDYPDKYCQNCWDVGQPYRKRMVQLQDICDEAIEKLEETWKNNAIHGDFKEGE